MMLIQKIVLFLLFSTSVFAENIECKDQLKGITLPSIAVDGLFIESKGTLILPIPINYCVKTGSLYEVKDEFGQNVGTLKISNVWSGEFNDIVISKEPDTSLVKLYMKQLSENHYNYRNFGDFLIPLMFEELGEFNIVETGRLTLIQFNYEMNPKFNLKVNKYSMPSTHPRVKNINYNDLLKFYKSNNHIIISVGNGPGQKSPNHVPKVFLHYYPESNKYQLPYRLDEAVVRFRRLQLPKDKNANIIVTNLGQQQSEAYNLVIEILAQGYKNVFWLNDFNVIFNGAAPNTRDIIPPKDLISAEAVVSLMKRNAVELLDIRSPEDIFEESISTARGTEARMYKPQDYIDLLLKMPSKNRLVPVESVKIDHNPYFHLKYSPLKGPAKKIVIFSNNTTTVYGPSIDLQKRSKNFLKKIWNLDNVSILDGGLESFYSYTRWMSDPNLKLKSIIEKNQKEVPSNVRIKK